MKRRQSTVLLFSFTGAVFLGGCGDDASPAEGDVTGGGDMTEAIEPEPAPTPEGPLAAVFPLDPLDGAAPELVGLPHLPEPPRHLEGPFVRVRSCTPDLEGGKRNTYEYGNGATLETVSCTPEFKALADEDGNYLHITPPETRADDDGRFAEVMMYHHVSAIHSYFSDYNGIRDRDGGLDAITNLSTWNSDCEGWTYWSNAAYVPREALNYLMLGLELPGTRGDAIVFSGTPDRNFAFDTTVIYHEYTHAILGATRLSGVYLDDQGLNNLPGALNEAYADYFAGTLTEQSEVGRFALNDVAAADYCGDTIGEEDVVENYARDMVTPRRCPDDMVAQVHADSELFSTALWEMRQALGQRRADAIALYAVLQLTDETDFVIAANATVEAAGDIYGEEVRAQVAAFFDKRNLLTCERVVPVDRVGARGMALRHEGTRAFGQGNPFPGYVPGYVQYGFEVPEGTRKATVQVDAISGFGAPRDIVAEGAFRVGGAVRYHLGTTVGGGSHNATLTVNNRGQSFVLENPDGSVLIPGPWALAIHNTDRRMFRVRSMSVTFE